MAYLSSLADHEAGRTATVDVSGEAYRDICREGLAPPDTGPPDIKALQARRKFVVDALDATFPEGFLPELQTFLTSNEFLALYDEGVTEHAIDKQIDLLALFADDAEFTPALARFNYRGGYLPLDPAASALRSVVAYPRLHEFALSVLDAVTQGGSARVEFQHMVDAIAIALRNAEPVADPGDPERTGKLALDLLFAESPLLGTSRELLLVERDRRGLARVAGGGNALPEPFADMDGDGLADVDDKGRFTDRDGAAFLAPEPFGVDEDAMPWPRDVLGRALTEPDGALLYDYVDLDRTVIGALARDALTLVDPSKGTAFDLLRGASLLTGPRVMARRDYATGGIDYRGYDTTQSPLLDLLYGYLTVLDDPRIYDTIDYGRRLLRDHGAEAAQLVEGFVDTARRADLFPAAALEPDSPLFDDLMPVIQDILATPGLAEDLLRALEAPEVAALGQRFAEQISHNNLITIASQPVPGTKYYPLQAGFDTPVDRSKPDTGNNRSLFQRLLHLIHDSRGARLCSKAGATISFGVLGINIPVASYPSECDLLKINDIAVFYVQSIAWARDGNGNLQVGTPKARMPFTFNNGCRGLGCPLLGLLVNDALIEEQSGIEGFRFNPTPQALNRSLFLDPQPAFLANAMEPVRCNQGDRFIDKHAGTLMAWELNGFYDQVRPIAQAFADHNAEILFVDLLSVLHQHYPSRDSLDHQQTNPNGNSYAFASNLVSYEPLLVDVFERGTLLDALVATAPVRNRITANGKPGLQVLTGAARYLVSPQAGLTNRRGETTTQTDDGRPVTTLSPWYVIADANQTKLARLAAAPTEGAAWRGAVTNAVDVLLRGDEVTGAGWKFRNPRVRGVLVAVLDFVEARLRAHDAAGDRRAWLRQDLPGRVEDLITSPAFAGAADFVVSLQADPDARRELEAMLAYLVDEVANTEAFWTALYAASDLVQLALDDRDLVPIARVAGEALRGERGILTAQLELAKRACQSDQNRAFESLLHNLFSSHRAGHTAVGDLLDGITEVNRARPYDDLGLPYAAEDYQSAFRAVARFLGEERRGLRKFIQIIKSRNL